MTEPTAIVTGALIGGVFGAIGSLIGNWLEERKRADELFSTALEFMGGGTQRRNLGLAAITLYWRQFPRRKKLCAEMLIGSAIYLVDESKQKDASHEIFNLHRIMDLLAEMSPGIQDRRGYIRLEQVLDERIIKYQSEPKMGLWVAKVDLETWRHNLKNGTTVLN